MGSLVDGPGVRFVVFLAGCPLRCRYCHNPDTWGCSGDPTDAQTILSRIESTADFLRSSGGGVTLSGGEPLVQADFALEILAGSKRLGLHTALDTSGYLGDRMTDEFLASTDLVLLDIKSWDPDTYRQLTGVSIEPTLELARRLSEVCKPMWIRFVLVPGVTDDADNIRGLAEFASELRNLERFEVVPFHQMGRHKWERLGITYDLAQTPAATLDDIKRAKDLFEAGGLTVGDGVFPPCGQRSNEG